MLNSKKHYEENLTKSLESGKKYSDYALYLNNLYSAFSEEKKQLVFNDQKVKANIFMQMLMDKTQEELFIYGNRLDKKVSSLHGFVDAFKRVSQNKSIKVNILLNKETNNKEIEEILKSDFLVGNKLNNSLRYLNDKKCIEKIFDSKDVHITTVDNIAYRLENNTEMYKASGSFKRRKIATGLNELLTNLFNDDQCSSFNYNKN